VRSNYALERSVKRWFSRAAGARAMIAPAAPIMRRARPGQRGRYADATVVEIGRDHVVRT
jgi:hypothetical protein